MQIADGGFVCNAAASVIESLRRLGLAKAGTGVDGMAAPLQDENDRCAIAILEFAARSAVALVKRAGNMIRCAVAATDNL